MGQATSKVNRLRSASKGLIVTLDALGTLYRFKKPVGELYLDVARQCGLTTKTDPNDVTKAFKMCYQEHAAKYPNYGRDTLKSPEIWWDRLVFKTFSQVVDEADIPPRLGLKLYEHFSSGNAYELYPDVRPFLDTLKRLRNQLAADDPPLVLGVITNSDPRVRNVLESLSLDVGDVGQAALLSNAASIPEYMKTHQASFRPPWHDAYNTKRDFDFLVTSYECGSQKPSSKIFLTAQKHASVVMLAKASAQLDYSTPRDGMKSMLSTFKLVNDSVNSTSQMQFIHIGDSLTEDYDGAKAYGIDALHLDRDEKSTSVEGTIADLEEAATTINLLVQESVRERA